LPPFAGFLQPLAQQPSPLTQAVIGVLPHFAVHVLASPLSVSVVQTSPSLHEVGHLSAGLVLPLSQVSPASTTPLPHDVVQSWSVFALQIVVSQHESLTVRLHTVIFVFVHSAVQVAALPVSTSVVHELLSLHEVGQLPSHFSLPSTLPSPQTMTWLVQELSLASLQ